MEQHTGAIVTSLTYIGISLIILIIVVILLKSKKKMILKVKKGDFEASAGTVDEVEGNKPNKPSVSETKINVSKINCGLSDLNETEYKVNINKLKNHRLFTNTFGLLINKPKINFELYDEAIECGIKHEPENVVEFKKTIATIYFQRCLLLYYKDASEKWLKEMLTESKTVSVKDKTIQSLFGIFNILNGWDKGVIQNAMCGIEFICDDIHFNKLPSIFVKKMNSHIQPFIDKINISIEKIVYNSHTDWYGKALEIFDILELQLYNIHYIMNTVLILLNGEIESYLSMKKAKSNKYFGINQCLIDEYSREEAEESLEEDDFFNGKI